MPLTPDAIVPIANVFQPLIDVFEQVLIFIHDSTSFGWGMAIILLTVAVRIVLLPLTIKQFKSMTRLQQLAPDIKELQQKYKDDKQRLQQEMMKFYQENKVNPFSSCLPLVLQIPVFISLFYMLRHDLKVDICGPLSAIEKVGPVSSTACEQVVPGSAQFLFIPDLTDKATGGVLLALVVLYIGSQLFSSVLMSVTADKTQRMILIGLPFVFTIFVINFPAGLLVYWITTNTWTIGQQLIVRRAAGQPMPWVARREAAAAAARGEGPPGLGEMLRKARGEAVTKAAPKPTPKARVAPPPSPRRKKKRSGRRR
ncbi:MAG: YidC/Oxa1 family membrane protein insertase [Solirubrobacteraceae bacterium]|nr:YidC/Oxa1 family membrane protein insertase [Solirubrobacteraceae bacterium]